jgi:hypothetical protein
MGMRFCWILLFLTFYNSFSQDIIYKNDGKKIFAIIKETNDNAFKYVLSENPNGPILTTQRSEINKIIFQNGALEDLRNAPAPSQLSKEEIKAIILEKIHTYAFDAESELRAYRGIFEDDYLKLWIMRSRGDEPFTNPVLFDFSRVYDFQDISYRQNEAFINIFVGFIDKKNRPDKIKLVIRILQKEEAEEIVKILKIYNRLLAEKKYSP